MYLLLCNLVFLVTSLVHKTTNFLYFPVTVCQYRSIIGILIFLFLIYGISLYFSWRLEGILNVDIKKLAENIFVIHTSFSSLLVQTIPDLFWMLSSCFDPIHKRFLWPPFFKEVMSCLWCTWCTQWNTITYFIGTSGFLSFHSLCVKMLKWTMVSFVCILALNQTTPH